MMIDETKRLQMIRASVAPTIAFGLLGACVSVVLPAVLAGPVQAGQITADEANLIISAEMFGAALATAAVSPFLARVNRTAVALFAAMIALCANITVVLQAPSYPWLAGIRFVAGIAEGTVLALAVAFIAGTRRPDRNVGFFVASHLSASTVILRLSPAAAIALGSQGGFWMLAGLATISLAAVVALPTTSQPAGAIPTTPAASGSGQSVCPAAIAAGFIGNVVFFTAAGSVWPLMVGLATGIGVPMADASGVLGNATLAGIAGALLAAWSGGIIGRRAALAVGTCVMLGSLLALANVSDLTSFAPAAIMFMASWIFLVPWYVGIVAMADPQGRAAAFSVATQYVGLALGPILAAMLHESGDYSSTLIAAGILAAIAALVMVYADRRSVAWRSSLES